VAPPREVKRCLVDTGILYAAADRDDAWNERVRDWLGGFRGRLLLASPVVPEVCYLMNAYLGRDVEIRFVRALRRRELSVEHFVDADLARVEELLEKYADLNLGFVDAANVAVAERLNVAAIATTDRRHFSAVRPRHVPAFTLLP
jgi:predicted nucleic acid-binding protein